MSSGSSKLETQSRVVSSWLRPHTKVISEKEKGNESPGDSGNSVAGLSKSGTDVAEPNPLVVDEFRLLDEPLEVKTEPNEFETAVHTEAYKRSLA
ncbi:unnamed protein product [Arabis nemorensis]|uniref:Uncharacterized protein n=1 Tax=Arabis nemorensis TaxID=586526 RepID=A0A565C5G7_9BRAS|nr:unnamed protein product [Arabis nemorensis]